MHLATASFDIPSLGWYVRVDHLGKPSKQFNAQEIRKLFEEHVGAVVHVSESLQEEKKWIKVQFQNEDAFKKALCMSGYSIAETRIHVSSFYALPSSKPRAKHLPKSKRGPDIRRNLYVLNVPHDLSAQAYYDLFTPHGTPTHTVLLKTQDSCSRRRGFVVMSTHEEAQDVINWLDGVCISLNALEICRGFQLRVTWANIDRSNGFLSGYDRSDFGQDAPASAHPAPSHPSPSMQSKCISIGMDTSTIVASNIPMSLFPAPEIDILFKPFGSIKHLQLIPPNPSSNHPLATLAPASPLAQTAIVTYENAGDAVAARNTLHGQVYEGFRLAVGFVSNLGSENYQVKQDTSVSLNHDSVSSASSSKTAFRCDFGDQASSFIPSEQVYRGLPTDPFHATQFLYMGHLSSERTSYGNWMLYPSLMSHASPHALQSSIPYEPDASVHSNQDGGSYPANSPSTGILW